MAYSGTFTSQWSSGGTNKQTTITKSSTGRVQAEETVATGQTEFKIHLPTIDISETVLIYILSTQDVTLDTNAADPGGTDTLELKANEPYIWWKYAPFVNMITADIITGIFIANDSGVTATVTFEAIMDATPA